ncbi:hypothetical protein [Thermus tengchongensis]|uniref:hypothetical protein n=1 Tax=Thermus tengchongensis TaxID=1214928 RepID=UPI001F45154D|nr:hypothetical protein [Thermus tengchongensis]
MARYLAGKANLYAVTADLNAKVVRLWQVAVQDGKQATVKELNTRTQRLPHRPKP